MDQIAERYEFLLHHPPFNQLPQPLLKKAVAGLKQQQVEPAQKILQFGQENDALFMIQQGAVELYDAAGTLRGRLGEGELFGHIALLTNQPVGGDIIAIEPTTLLVLPHALFQELRQAHIPFEQFFSQATTQVASTKAPTDKTPADLGLTIQVKEMLRYTPICGTPEMTILTAAQLMSREKVSCLPIMEAQKIVGIFTDRDLRNRVVAKNRPLDTPVAEVMTTHPLTIRDDRFAFEAMMSMSRHNVHHLPVLNHAQELCGVITTTDLVRLQTTNPVYLIGDIWKHTSVEELVATSRRIPQLVQRLVDADAKAQDIGHVVTVVTDALTQRLLTLAEEKFGPPPVPYAWLVFGSQARQEQTAHSDQDNALLISDEMQPADDAYFAQLASFVSDGLNACGYVYCPGNIMATNPRWRQPLQKWQSYFEQWITRPEPEALLNASIFFDMRHIYGDESLTAALQESILRQAPHNQRFLGQLSANALSFQPPLGFFRRFVLEKDGSNKNTFDLKQRGVVPIIEMARVFSLAEGLAAVNTFERIEQAAPTAAIAPEDAINLLDALEFIFYIRLRHQGQQLGRGELPDNHVAPEGLSRFERQHLKAAFTIVSKMQDALARRYNATMMG